MHASDDSLQCPVDGGDPPTTFHRHIEVVGESTSCHFKDIVRCFLVEEDLTESRDEGARGTAVEGEREQTGRISYF